MSLLFGDTEEKTVVRHIVGPTKIVNVSQPKVSHHLRSPVSMRTEKELKWLIEEKRLDDSLISAAIKSFLSNEPFELFFGSH